MATERKEPTFSAAPVKGDSTATKPQKARSAPAPAKVIVQKQSSGFLWLIFLLVVGAIAGVGFTFLQLQQSQQVIAGQQIRIDELENKLLLTGDESTQSLTALTANLKELDKDVTLAMSEVDKLWATRNANVKKIDQAKKDLSNNISKTGASITALEGKLDQPISALEQRTGEQALLIQSLRDRLSEQKKTTASLSKQIKQFSSATKKVNKISERVDGYEETIRSFDKFRVTTNRDLLVLKERAGVLSAPAK